MQAKQEIRGSRVLRDFEINKILGSGGFGLVLQVQRRTDQKKYALKLNINKDSHIENEVQNFARIPAHDNVVGYYASWMDTITMAEMRSLERIGFSVKALGIPPGVQQMQLLCIQMELCGQDLRHWLRQQASVNETKCKGIFQQLLAGLQHIHNQKLIHRDLKPDNIFFTLTNPNKVKIGDFGIAAVHHGTAGAQHTRGFGTILYLAPEQYTSKYGRKADLYAMGLILFEIYHPPAQKSLEQSLTQLKNLKSLPIEFRNWPDVSRTILSLLEYDPKKRPTIANLLESPLVKKDVQVGKVKDVVEMQKCFQALDLGRKEVHENITCDGCKTRPIKGIRYNCKSCNDFDYCNDCYRSSVSHRSKHEFTTISKPRLGHPAAVIDNDVVHHGVRCDVCQEKPVKGRRYMCQSCNNYDLCRRCYVSQVVHREKHTFSMFTVCQMHRRVCREV